MRKPKQSTAAEIRPNSHLEERAAAIRGGKGKLLKSKAGAGPRAQADPPPTSASREAEPPQKATHPLGTVAVPLGTHPDAYGLVVDENGLGLHAAPGAHVIVEPIPPAKAGLAVFYMKGQPGPTIFDLTRNFQPDRALPFASGSEVVPLIEVCVPDTGRIGHMRTDLVATIHKVRGIYTPVEIMDQHHPAPAALPEMTECLEGMGEHYVEGGAAYPLVRPGETVVYDPSQREPTSGALCVLQWNGGTRDVLQTNRRRVGGWNEEGWFADPVNRPSSRAMLERRLASGSPGLLYASDGPYTEAHLRERIVGTVVGVLVPTRETSKPRALVPALLPTAHADDAPAEAQPAPLAQACDQAVRDWHAIQPTSRAEDWGDEQLDAALDAYNAVFRRAINEPSHDMADVRAKARLLLHDLIEHTTGHNPSDETTLTDDARLIRVVLREVADLSEGSSPTTLPDPILTAIKAHHAAHKAFRATVNPQDAVWRRQQGLETSDGAMAPARAAYEGTGERMVENVR